MAQEAFLFEGPEKKLVVDFCVSRSNPNGLLNVSADAWQEMLDLAGCKIISSLCDEKVHSYVLSESSLFVYPFQVTIKTCGTTTLLKCVSKMIEIATAQKLAVYFVTYTRKNFMFPSKQLFPHISFDAEVSTLQEQFDGAGDAYILGPATGEHWYLFLADFTDANPEDERHQILEVMMTELDPEVMALFHKSETSLPAKELTRHLGLDVLLPNAKTDEFFFDPCGYSLNAIADGWYYTIHITPESTHSYVSFETNVEYVTSFDDLVNKVVATFRPGKFSVAIFTDHAARAAASHRNNTETIRTEGSEFYRSHKTSQEFEGDYSVTLQNFLSSAVPKRSLRSATSSPCLPGLLAQNSNLEHLLSRHE